MKKSILLTLVLIATVATSIAQFGLKGGGTVSKFANGVERDLEPKINFVAGIYDRIYLTEHLSLQPEILYHGKGTLINHDPSYDRSRWRDQFRMNVNYLETSVALNAHIGNFALHGGVFGAYMIRMTNGKWNYDNLVVVYDRNQFIKWDFGPTFGFSYDLYGAIIQANGTIGLNWLAEDGKPLGWHEANRAFKNQTLDLSLLIPFKVRPRHIHRREKVLDIIKE